MHENPFRYPNAIQINYFPYACCNAKGIEAVMGDGSKAEKAVVGYGRCRSHRGIPERPASKALHMQILSMQYTSSATESRPTQIPFLSSYCLLIRRIVRIIVGRLFQAFQSHSPMKLSRSWTLRYPFASINSFKSS